MKGRMKNENITAFWWNGIGIAQENVMPALWGGTINGAAHVDLTGPHFLYRHGRSVLGKPRIGLHYRAAFVAGAQVFTGVKMLEVGEKIGFNIAQRKVHLV